MGLGSTITSLVRNCSNSSRLKLWFFCSELTTTDKSNITYLLNSEYFRGTTEFIDLNVKNIFGHLNPLHQDWTAYGRLLIPEIINDSYALYLDADLIIELDILQLSTVKSNKILSAVHEGPVRLALDNHLFINKLNWDPTAPYFNSGVLLFNIKQWAKCNTSSNLKEISESYSAHLVSHDQTLLNALCAGKFNQLSKEFNTSWPPNKPAPNTYDKCIIHFIGSPKPWDISGRIIHNSYNIWLQYNTNFWNQKYGKLSPGKLLRTWYIRKSILKNLKHKFFSMLNN